MSHQSRGVRVEKKIKRTPTGNLSSPILVKTLRSPLIDLRSKFWERFLCFLALEWSRRFYETEQSPQHARSLPWVSLLPRKRLRIDFIK